MNHIKRKKRIDNEERQQAYEQACEQARREWFNIVVQHYIKQREANGGRAVLVVETPKKKK